MPRQEDRTHPKEGPTAEAAGKFFRGGKRRSVRGSASKRRRPIWPKRNYPSVNRFTPPAIRNEKQARQSVRRIDVCEWARERACRHPSRFLGGRSRFDPCHSGLDAGLARATLQYNLLPVIVDRKAIVRAEEFRVSSRRGPPTDEHGHQRRMEFSAALSAPS
jgi:hypothetical protein